MSLRNYLPAVSVLLLSFAAGRLLASDTNVAAAASTNSLSPAVTNNAAMADLEVLVAKINQKIKQNQADETNLADNLKEFDLLLAKHKSADETDRARILIMKAQLYTQVLNDAAKAAETFKQFKKDFPGVQLNGNIDELIAILERRAQTQEIQKTLVAGAKFPDFKEQDLNGKPLSVSQYKGKVVLIDFWATWCMPCVMTLPEVISAYDKYHDKGLEVIGISLDEERTKLVHFIKDRSMRWPQYNDGKKWDSKLARQYGIEAIPATFLLDRNGKIVGRDLHGEELEMAIAQALKTM